MGNQQHTPHRRTCNYVQKQSSTYAMAFVACKIHSCKKVECRRLPVTRQRLLQTKIRSSREPPPPPPALELVYIQHGDRAFWFYLITEREECLLAEGGALISQAPGLRCVAPQRRVATYCSLQHLTVGIYFMVARARNVP